MNRNYVYPASEAQALADAIVACPLTHLAIVAWLSGTLPSSEFLSCLKLKAEMVLQEASDEAKEEVSHG